MTLHDKKLRGFTLIELMVSMLITVIVATIAYEAYHVVRGLWSRYRIGVEEDAAIIRAISLLGEDLELARFVVAENGGAVICQAFSDRESVNYLFNPTGIVRFYGQDMRDTFKIPLASFAIKESSQPPGKKLLDELTFEYGEPSRLFRFVKQYTSSDLLSLENK